MTESNNQQSGRHAAKPDDLGDRSTVNIKKYLLKDEELERRAAAESQGRHAAPEAQS